MRQSKKELFREIIRFLIIGGCATICDYIVFYIFNIFILNGLNQSLNLFISQTLGFLTGMFFNWFLQKKVFNYVSDTQLRDKVVFIKFLVVSLIGLLISNVGLLLFSLGLNKIDYVILGFTFDDLYLFFSKCFMTFVVLVWNYLARKFYVFKRR